MKLYIDYVNNFSNALKSYKNLLADNKANYIFYSKCLYFLIW